MQYLRARYYSPAQGRFITHDPFPGYLNQPSTLNAYAYALNNPVTLTDPSGEFVSPIAAIAIGGFAAGAVYDAYRETDGLTDFCQYDILQTLVAGAGGAAAASMAAVMLVSGAGMAGMGLQGVALGLYGIGTSTGAATSLFIAGTTTVSWAGMAMSWLVAGNSWSNPSSGIQLKPTPSSPNGRNPYGREGVNANEYGPASSYTNKILLQKQLASQQQMGETGIPLAGNGTNTPLRNEAMLTSRYGGNQSDWSKMTSSSYTGWDGVKFETHWYENSITGLRVEFKTKIPDL